MRNTQPCDKKRISRPCVLIILKERVMVEPHRKARPAGRLAPVPELCSGYGHLDVLASPTARDDVWSLFVG
ncbi:MAG TPA: hypothetical protein PLN32_06500 [Methanoregulaceae archaeon]|nr:hypothetical protein [Methanoregulaceae archaeon]